MNETNYDELVDQRMISRADEHHAAMVKRLTAAWGQVQAAEKDRDAALAVRSAAIEGKGDLSPMDADSRVEVTERALRLATLVHEAAERALKGAEDGQLAARAKAWRPVYLDGVRRRIAAARAADAARAALEEADKEHAEATQALWVARSNGLLGVEAVHDGGPRRLGTEKEELKLWDSNGFDPADGKYFHWT